MDKSNVMELLPSIIYGDSRLCHNCGHQQIVQVPDKGSPLIYSYRENKAGKILEDELIMIGYSNKNDELGLCYYCRKIFLRLSQPDHPTQFNTQLRIQLKEKIVVSETHYV